MNNSNRLAEWLDANGNKINLNNLTTATAKQTNDLFKDRFMKLARHIEDYHAWSSILYVSEWELDLEYNTGADSFSLDIDVNSESIDAVVYNNKTGSSVVNITAEHDEWAKILSSLKSKGIIGDVKACESVSLSTIDDFKLYENLWD